MRRALILAAGKGTRMKSNVPKCAYPLLNKPMILYQVEALERANINEIFVVVGNDFQVFKDILGTRVTFVYQKEKLGTGHAVLCARKFLENNDDETIILPGDMPLINTPLIEKLFDSHLEMGNDITVVSTVTEDPKGYGRIIYDEYGNIFQIIEEKDCNDIQKRIKEINSGVFVIKGSTFIKELDKININTRSNEYHLTDVVKISYQKKKISVYKSSNNYDLMGINNLHQIAIAEKNLRRMINKSMMESGVSMINPDTITIGHDVIIEQGVKILPNTTITGQTHIRSGSVVGPNTELNDAHVEEECIIRHSLVYDSLIGRGSRIGPFAHVRDKAIIGEKNRIGNFVEVKKSKTGRDTKASHISYIGDADIGKNVNFGCGSITVNYDGKTKHITEIGDNVFVGCNVNLVAPIKISDDVFIAAGSTVTKDIPKGALAVARNKQINKEDYFKK